MLMMDGERERSTEREAFMTMVGTVHSRDGDRRSHRVWKTAKLPVRVEKSCGVHAPM